MASFFLKAKHVGLDYVEAVDIYDPVINDVLCFPETKKDRLL